MSNRHDRTAKLVVRGGAVFAIIWVLWALVSLAAFGGVVYVAWHFASKFW